MKKTLFYFQISVLVFLSCSCAKYDYSIRFTNNYNQTINNVAAGTVGFGTVDPGKTTDYKPIRAKSFLISGMSINGQSLQGSESMSGSGKHKWTITLNSKGTIDFTEDNI